MVGLLSLANACLLAIDILENPIPSYIYTLLQSHRARVGVMNFHCFVRHVCFQELDSWLCYDIFSLLPTRVSTIEKCDKTPMCLCSKSITAVLKTIEISEKEVVLMHMGNTFILVVAWASLVTTW